MKQKKQKATPRAARRPARHDPGRNDGPSLAADLETLTQRYRTAIADVVQAELDEMGDSPTAEERSAARERGRKKLAVLRYYHHEAVQQRIDRAFRGAA